MASLLPSQPPTTKVAVFCVSACSGVGDIQRGADPEEREIYIYIQEQAPGENGSFGRWLGPLRLLLLLLLDCKITDREERRGEPKRACVCVRVSVKQRLDGSLSSSGTPQALIHLFKPDRRQHAKRGLQRQSAVSITSSSPLSESVLLLVLFSLSHTHITFSSGLFLMKAQTSQQRTGVSETSSAAPGRSRSHLRNSIRAGLWRPPTHQDPSQRKPRRRVYGPGAS